jgi:hypothetical protein
LTSNEGNDVRKRKGYVSNEKLAKAFVDCRGIVSLAAKKVGLSRRAVYKRLDASVELQDALVDARDSADDFVEGMLFSKIADGDIAAIIFYLKCRCTHRGFVEPQFLQVLGNVRHQHEIPVETNVREVVAELAKDPDWRRFALESEAADCHPRLLGDQRDQAREPDG